MKIKALILLSVFIMAFAFTSQAIAGDWKVGRTEVRYDTPPRQAYCFAKHDHTPLGRANFFIKTQSPQDYMFGKMFKKKSPKCKFVLFPVFKNTMYVVDSAAGIETAYDDILSGKLTGVEADSRKYDRNCIPFRYLEEMIGFKFIVKTSDGEFWAVVLDRFVGDKADFRFRKL